jgi:hypothetical protein
VGKEIGVSLKVIVFELDTEEEKVMRPGARHRIDNADGG